MRTIYPGVNCQLDSTRNEYSYSEFQNHFLLLQKQSQRYTMCLYIKKYTFCKSMENVLLSIFQLKENFGECVCSSWKKIYILDLLFILATFLPPAPNKEKDLVHFFLGERTNLTQKEILHMQQVAIGFKLRNNICFSS